jgi:hypothetical protein
MHAFHVPQVTSCVCSGNIHVKLLLMENVYKFLIINVFHSHLYCFSSVRDDTEAAAFDSQSSSLIKLNNGTILYLREVNKFLALVCILREDNFDRQGNV